MRTLLDGRPFGGVFGLDAALAEPMVEEPEELTAPDLLGFAGLAPASLRGYPLEMHVAEKLHAYTLPRPRENSRVKDLPDLALLASLRVLEADRLRRVLELVFRNRATHELPPSVPDPPASWTAVYERMAAVDRLPWPEMASLLAAVRAFLDPVLAGGGGGMVPGRLGLADTFRQLTQRRAWLKAVHRRSLRVSHELRSFKPRLGRPLKGMIAEGEFGDHDKETSHRRSKVAKE